MASGEIALVQHLVLCFLLGRFRWSEGTRDSSYQTEREEGGSREEKTEDKDRGVLRRDGGQGRHTNTFVGVRDRANMEQSCGDLMEERGEGEDRGQRRVVKPAFFLCGFTYRFFLFPELLLGVDGWRFTRSE